MRRKRRRKKRIVTVAVLLSAVLMAAAVLYLTGFLSVFEMEKTSEKAGAGIAYIAVNEQNAVVDKSGRVTETLIDKPESLICIDGLNSESPVLNETLVCDNEDYFYYALDIAGELNQNSIEAETVTINSEGEAEILINNVTVKLGAESETAEKIRDLKDLYVHVKDLCGILNMESINETMGYVFKKIENTAASEPAQTENSEDVEPTEEFEDENTEEYRDEYSDGNNETSGEYQDEYTEEYQDDYTDEYQDDYTDEYQDDYSGEYTENYS